MQIRQSQLYRTTCQFADFMGSPTAGPWRAGPVANFPRVLPGNWRCALSGSGSTAGLLPFWGLVSPWHVAWDILLINEMQEREALAQIRQGLASFLPEKRPDDKYFAFCRPSGLCCNSSPLLGQRDSSQRRCIKNGRGCVLTEVELQKEMTGQVWPGGQPLN